MSISIPSTLHLHDILTNTHVYPLLAFLEKCTTDVQHKHGKSFEKPYFIPKNVAKNVGIKGLRYLKVYYAGKFKYRI